MGNGLKIMDVPPAASNQILAERAGREVPFFSIITISLNNCGALERAIDSISNQAFRDYELLIIDGGSTDGTVELARRRASEIDKFVSEPDSGIYNALNKGIAMARGKVIGLIHADDVLAFNALTRYKTTFEATGADIVLGDCIYFDSSGKFQAYKPARNYGLETMFRGITGAHEAVFIKSSAYRRHGCYDETYRSAADYKLLSNMIISGATTACTESVEVYKLAGGESFSRDVEFKENYRLALERLPNLKPDEYAILLKLKNYRDIDRDDYLNLYNLLPRLSANSSVLRGLSMTLLTILMGDSKSISFRRNVATNQFHRDAVDDDRILFCISSIKGISGGAERVLIDIASQMSARGHEILIGCADGRVGNPFYRPDMPVDLVDIFEPPFNRLLDFSSDLVTEVSSLINRMPEDILKVTYGCKALRGQFENWNQFVLLCRQTISATPDHIRAEMRNEVNGWVEKHGSRVRRWRGLIREFKPGTVVPFMISSSTEAYIAARGTKTRVVISNHGNPIRDYLYQDDWDDGLLDRSLRFFAILSSHKNIWLQDTFLASIPGQAASKSIVIGNPIRADIREHTGQRKKVVLGVGRLIPIKRFEVLIKAFARIAGQFIDWRLEIYGDGPERVGLQALIETLGLVGRVSLNGATRDIFRAYQNASMIVSCSEMEGFGMTVAEALASGLPAIVPASTSALAILVDDGLCGLHVDGPDLVNGFAAAMQHMMSSDLLRDEMSKVATKSMEKYSVSRVVDLWEAALVASHRALA